MEAPMQKVKKHPFTLIEIMAVIGIIAVLAGLTVGVSSLVMEKAAEAKTKSAIKMLEMAFSRYKDAYGCYPICLTKKQENGSDPLDPSLFRPLRLSSAYDHGIWKFLDEKFLKQNTLPDPNTDDEVEKVYVIDGYGNPLVFRYPGYFNKGKFDLGSVGKDRFFGNGKGVANDVPDKEFKEGFWKQTDKSDDEKQYKLYQSNFGKGDDIVNFANNAEF